MKRKIKQSSAPQSARKPDPAAALAQGLAHHRAGRLDEAERLYRAVPRRHPAYPDALHLRGLVVHQRGDNRRAADLIRRALESQPRNPVYHYNLGEVLRADRRHEPAIRHYQRAIALQPDYADAHYNLGNALVDLERWQEAVDAFRRALQYTRNDADLHNNLGNALLATGERNAAIEQYRMALAIAPDSGDIRLNLASALGDAGCTDEAIAGFRELIRREPGNGVAYSRLARLLYEHGDPVAAYRYLDVWREQAGVESDALHDIAAAYERVRNVEAAINIYRNLLSRNADDVAACTGLGGCLQQQGRFSDALPWLTRALTLHPDSGAVYLTLVENRAHRFSAGQLARMERLAEDRKVGERVRIGLHFALGRLRAADGDAGTAFDHYRLGNQLHAHRKPFHPDVFSSRIECILETFNRDFFAQRKGYGEASDVPVFIVGMPRSGTTLVEQIVASHPCAFGAGELADISCMTRELPALLGSDEPFPAQARQLGPTLASELGRRYLNALAARAPDAVRVTDKMPFNLHWLGLIALILPGARVVYCRRDPLDTCLSCYFQLFDEGLAFTYDLAHLGLVYRAHERLMRHWAEHLPLPLLTVDYEALVSDQEAESRRLVEFLGLEWDERCLQFHRTDRAVRTASVWQVKQPLYRSSVGRWRAYEQWLGPLKESLEAHREKG